jgi:hypothetical protein
LYIYASPYGAVKAFAMIAERVKVAAPSAEQHVADCLQADVRFAIPLGHINIYRGIDRTFTALSF